jgi:hypothetical protein
MLVMTYNTPELLLVGAAKNLVLLGCDLDEVSDFIPEQYASCRLDNTNPPKADADTLLF